MRCRPLLPLVVVLAALAGFAASLAAQSGPVLPGSPSAGAYDPLAVSPAGPSLLNAPNLTPGAIALMDLERRFAADVATGGGRAFASWFAEDAVSLSNGRPVQLGRGAIAATANWSPAVYQLTWTPTGAQMGPSNDMGFTWGHYEGHSKDAHGEPIVVVGRYITVWKRAADGAWKVALDASAQEPPDAGTCCALPKP